MSILVSSHPTSLGRSSGMTNGNHYPLDRHHSPSVSSLPKHFNVPFAIQHGYFRCIRYLLQLRYDPNERDGQLRTPLILCAYVDNDRWSLSLAQNLLEKGAKVALEDHARRNAMHHACALQRLHLVKLFLSCLDFNIDAKDCEGNTCLHYVAITGNCEIAELLMRSAEKVGVRLDQVVNREGCSAAVLALKYGHLECANQISHRDSDEFFVVPRPLSIYETIPANEEVQRTSSHSGSTKKNLSNGVPKRMAIRPSNFSFGLLKIIFNESDPGYSTRLAGLCREDKEIRRKKRKTHEKKSEALEQSLMMMTTKPDRTTSTMIDEMQCSSTEAVVNAVQTLHLNRERKLNGYRPQMDLSPLEEMSPRIPSELDLNDILQKSSSTFLQTMNSKVNLLLDDANKTHSSINQKLIQNDDAKSKHSNSTIYRQTSNTSTTLTESNLFKTTSKKSSPSLTVHPPTSQRLLSSNNKSIGSVKKKTSPNDRYRSASNASRPLDSNSSTFVANMLGGRSVSNLGRYRSATDKSLTIQEAKGPTSRYNQPEELFGLRPAELFGSNQHQPKILDPRSNQRESKRSSTHLWQQDLDQIINLYSVHQSSNYRRPALPPHSMATPLIGPHETHADFGSNVRHRRGSISKTSSSTHSKTNLPSKPPVVVPPTHFPRRNSISRSTTKLAHPS